MHETIETTEEIEIAASNMPFAHENARTRDEFENKTLTQIAFLFLAIDDFDRVYHEDLKKRTSTANKIARRMWQYLPTYVTEITFENRISVPKPQKQTDPDKLIQSLSETWRLTNVEDHIKYLSSQVITETGTKNLARINETRARIRRIRG